MLARGCRLQLMMTKEAGDSSHRHPAREHLRWTCREISVVNNSIHITQPHAKRFIPKINPKRIKPPNRPGINQNLPLQRAALMLPRHSSSAVPAELEALVLHEASPVSRHGEGVGGDPAQPETSEFGAEGTGAGEWVLQVQVGGEEEAEAAAVAVALELFGLGGSGGGEGGHDGRFDGRNGCRYPGR